MVTDECKHQRTVPKIDCREHFATLTSFYRVHLTDSDIGVGGDEFLKIIIGTPYMALLIDTDRLFLLTDLDTPSDLKLQDKIIQQEALLLPL